MREDERVPKVDERNQTVILDAAGLQRLARALDVPGVVAAYLIGSQARRTAGQLSDIDVAVWMDPWLDRDERWALRLALIDAAAIAAGTEEIEIVPLDDADLVLRHRAVREHILLVDRDPRRRIERETTAMLEYFDTAPLRAVIAEGRRRRLAEGRFGRP